MIFDCSGHSRNYIGIIGRRIVSLIPHLSHQSKQNPTNSKLHRHHQGRQRLFSKDRVHPEDLQKSLDAFRDGVKNKEAFACERRLKGVDGKYRWYSTKGAPIIDEEGILTCFYGTCMDNTDDKELEREMKILPESLPQMV
jgi:hypothetical protein